MKQKLKIIENDDKYFDYFWDAVDQAEHIICVTTYDMDHKMIASITISKLTNAAKRGVKIYLIVDDLNFYIDFE